MPTMATAEVKLSQDELKKQAAWKAVEYVTSGMKLGLGTGSTAAFAVDKIGQLLKDGTLKDIVAVPTSIRTYEQALSALLLLTARCFTSEIWCQREQKIAVAMYHGICKCRFSCWTRLHNVERACRSGHTTGNSG